jgi:hypothetical protein
LSARFDFPAAGPLHPLAKKDAERRGRQFGQP